MHEGLHHLPDFIGLATGHIDLASYRSLLGRLFGFQAPTEAGITSALAEIAFDLDVRALRRASLLQDDLGSLGMASAEIDALPRLATPSFKSSAEAIGALYVIEGATLGGRQLAQGLDRLLGSGIECGRRFLLAGADPARPSWRDVRAALDRCGAEQIQLAEMIHGAKCTFQSFGLWLAVQSRFEPRDQMPQDAV